MPCPIVLIFLNVELTKNSQIDQLKIVNGHFDCHFGITFSLLSVVLVLALVLWLVLVLQHVVTGYPRYPIWSSVSGLVGCDPLRLSHAL